MPWITLFTKQDYLLPKFNLNKCLKCTGFDSPDTYAYSICLRLLLDRKSETNLEEKNKITSDYRLHKSRAK